MMMIVEETRSAAPMAAVMSVLPQNTKVYFAQKSQQINPLSGLGIVDASRQFTFFLLVGIVCLFSH